MNTFYILKIKPHFSNKFLLSKAKEFLFFNIGNSKLSLNFLASSEKIDKRTMRRFNEFTSFLFRHINFILFLNKICNKIFKSGNRALIGNRIKEVQILWYYGHVLQVISFSATHSGRPDCSCLNDTEIETAYLQFGVKPRSHSINLQNLS